MRNVCQLIFNSDASIGRTPDPWFRVHTLLFRRPKTDFFHIALEPGARGRFLGMLVAIPLAAYSVAGFEVTTMLVTSHGWLGGLSNSLPLTRSSAEAVQPRTSVIRTMKFITFCLVTFYVSEDLYL